MPPSTRPKGVESGWMSSRLQSEVIIRVRDTGIGMEPDLLPKVFDLFLQGERRAGLSHEGGGIGLSLAKNLVELHGGTITAHSQGPDMGSEFVVKLPVISRVHSKREQSPKVTQHEVSESLPRRRILIVDDNVQAADSLGRLMSVVFGQDVRVVYNGKSALEMAGSFLPDVILLDLEMAGMDGYEVAMRLRERPRVLQGSDRGSDRLGTRGRSPSITGNGIRPAPGQASYGERPESVARRSQAEA